MAAAATEMHETGHSLNLGRADDGPPECRLYNNFEVYSGNDGSDGYAEDETSEQLRAGGPETWSTMSTLNPTLTTQPVYGRYYVFSLEELATVDNQG